jgi:hypothetical protein
MPNDDLISKLTPDDRAHVYAQETARLAAEHGTTNAFSRMTHAVTSRVRTPYLIALVVVIVLVVIAAFGLHARFDRNGRYDGRGASKYEDAYGRGPRGMMMRGGFNRGDQYGQYNQNGQTYQNDQYIQPPMMGGRGFIGGGTVAPNGTNGVPIPPTPRTSQPQPGAAPAIPSQAPTAPTPADGTTSTPSV